MFAPALTWLGTGAGSPESDCTDQVWALMIAAGHAPIELKALLTRSSIERALVVLKKVAAIEAEACQQSAWLG